jgi:molybdate transport system substrate-binding protein
MTVLAPPSMSYALTELIRLYSREHNIVITGSFDYANKLIKNIEEGLPADILISAHPLWVKHLKQKGLADVSSITNLVKNSIVIVSNAEDESDIKDLNDIKRAIASINPHLHYNLVIADSGKDSLGIYSKQIINNLFAEVPKESIITTNMNVLKYINNKKTFGIAYYSETFDNDNMQILLSIPQENYDEVIYQAAVIAGENMEDAREFLQFLKTPIAKKIFTKYGFLVLQ